MAKKSDKTITKPAAVKPEPKADKPAEPEKTELADVVKDEDANLSEGPPAPVEVPPEPPKKSRVSGPDGGFGVPSDEPVVKPAERKIRLKNLRNKAVSITLEHEVYCAAIGRCVCASRDVVRWRQVERKSAVQAPRVESLRVPKSINLAPMGTSEPLHEAAKDCADVKSKLVNRPQKIKVLPA